MPKKKENLSPKERLMKAVIPKEEEPYKLPNNWVWTRLGDITEKNQYGYTAKAEQNGKIKYLRITDIQDNKVNWKTVPFCSIDEKDLEKFKLKENDIVVTRTGATTGKSFLIESINCEAVFASYLIRIRALNGLPKFLWNYMKANIYWKQITEFSSGIAQPGVNAQKLENLLLPLPPLNEQKRIVEKLDSLFEKTGRIKEIIEEVKEKTSSRREAVLSKAFTGELTEKWRAENKTENAKELLLKINEEKLKNNPKIKIKDISEMVVNEDEIPYKIPENWVWTRLGDITEFIDYRGKTPVKVETGISLITAKNIKKGYINEEPREFIKEEDYEGWMTRGIPQKGDVAITTEAPLGNVAQLNFDYKFALAQRVITLTNINFNKRYLFYSMLATYFQAQLKEYATGSTVEGIKSKLLKLVKIPLPPLEEQKEIVKILDKVFEEENKISELISLEEKVEILEKTILDKAFRGELGTGNINDEPAIELLKRALEEKMGKK